MKHERIRELLALELYGELDAAEAAELDVHLRSCGDCQAARARLARGLGRLVPRTPAGMEDPPDELPAGWREGLEAAVAVGGTPTPSRGRAWPWALAAGLAAGWLLGWAGWAGWAPSAAQRDAPEEAREVLVASNAPSSAAEASDGSSFSRPTPPPPAPTRTESARALGYARR